MLFPRLINTFNIVFNIFVERKEIYHLYISFFDFITQLAVYTLCSISKTKIEVHYAKNTYEA